MKPSRPAQNGPAEWAVLPFIKPGQIVVGVDEVGRGAWAGPLLVAAVVLGGAVPTGITDSKLLRPRRRQELARHIKAAAGGIGFGWVPAPELDHIGLAAALKLAAGRALETVGCAFDLVVLDGSVNFVPGEAGARTHVLPRADQLVPEVAAASIVAKVARDAYLRRLHQADPRYGFDVHVGYGTAGHAAALAQHGPSAQHRLSFRPVAAVAAARNSHQS